MIFDKLANSFAHRIVSRSGKEIVRNKLNRTYLNQYDFRVATVFDIGVDTGTPWLYETFPSAKFVLVDPLEEARRHVEAIAPNIGYVFHETALADYKGTADIHIPAKADGVKTSMSSMMQRSDSTAARLIRTTRREVPVTLLDELSAACEPPFGIKIDVEGFELPVLRGGPRSLNRCAFVILELSVTRRFDGMYPPSQIFALLAEHGLELRDVVAVTGSERGALPRRMDCLFTRWAA
jgi:FkbM family methyltransferase